MDTDYTNEVAFAQQHWREYAREVAHIKNLLDLASFIAIIAGGIVILTPFIIIPTAKWGVATLLAVLTVFAIGRGLLLMREERIAFREAYSEEAALLDEYSAW